MSNSNQNLSKEEKLVIAAISALAGLDRKVLALALVHSLSRTMPPEALEGKSENHVRVMTCMAAMGMVQCMMEAMAKQAKRTAAKREATKEVPDTAFSEEDKAKAQEILSAFMERSGVHLKS